MGEGSGTFVGVGSWVGVMVGVGMSVGGMVGRAVFMLAAAAWSSPLASQGWVFQKVSSV